MFFSGIHDLSAAKSHMRTVLGGYQPLELRLELGVDVRDELSNPLQESGSP